MKFKDYLAGAAEVVEATTSISPDNADLSQMMDFAKTVYDEKINGKSPRKGVGFSFSIEGRKHSVEFHGLSTGAQSVLTRSFAKQVLEKAGVKFSQVEMIPGKAEIPLVSGPDLFTTIRWTKTAEDSKINWWMAATSEVNTKVWRYLVGLQGSINVSTLKATRLSFNKT